MPVLFNTSITGCVETTFCCPPLTGTKVIADLSFLNFNQAWRSFYMEKKPGGADVFRPDAAVLSMVHLGRVYHDDERNDFITLIQGSKAFGGDMEVAALVEAWHDYGGEQCKCLPAF